jgi:hypothetical protein
VSGYCCTSLLYSAIGPDSAPGQFALTRRFVVGVTGFEPAASSSRTRPRLAPGGRARLARVRECPAWCTVRRGHRQAFSQAASPGFVHAHRSSSEWSSPHVGRLARSGA